MSTTATFHFHGQDWFPHKAGDPMPCEEEAEIEVILTHCVLAGGSLRGDIWRWSALNNGRDIIGWRYATPPQEKDELARLREENASMRTAIKAIYDATECYADGAEDATSHDKLANEIANLAKPFTESK